MIKMPLPLQGVRVLELAGLAPGNAVALKLESSH